MLYNLINQKPRKKLKLVQVNKLFYNHFKYSVTINLGFAGIFRNKNLLYVRKTLDTIKFYYDHYSERNITQSSGNLGLPAWVSNGIDRGLGISNPDSISTRYNLLASYTFTYNDYVEANTLYQILSNNPEPMIRIEYSECLKIYSNDKEFLLGLAKKLRVVEFAEPGEKLEALLEGNPNVLLTTKSGYDYKILFKSGYYKNSPFSAFAKWCKSNSSKVRITDQTLRLLEDQKSVDGRYFFVKDDKTLTVINLMIGPYLGKTFKLINKAEIDK